MLKYRLVFRSTRCALLNVRGATRTHHICSLCVGFHPVEPNHNYLPPHRIQQPDFPPRRACAPQQQEYHSYRTITFQTLLASPQSCTAAVLNSVNRLMIGSEYNKQYNTDYDVNTWPRIGVLFGVALLLCGSDRPQGECQNSSRDQV